MRNITIYFIYPWQLNIVSVKMDEHYMQINGNESHISSFKLILLLILPSCHNHCISLWSCLQRDIAMPASDSWQTDKYDILSLALPSKLLWILRILYLLLTMCEICWELLFYKLYDDVNHVMKYWNNIGNTAHKHLQVALDFRCRHIHVTNIAHMWCVISPIKLELAHEKWYCSLLNAFCEGKVSDHCPDVVQPTPAVHTDIPLEKLNMTLCHMTAQTWKRK